MENKVILNLLSGKYVEREGEQRKYKMIKVITPKEQDFYNQKATDKLLEDIQSYKANTNTSIYFAIKMITDKAKRFEYINNEKGLIYDCNMSTPPLKYIAENAERGKYSPHNYY